MTSPIRPGAVAGQRTQSQQRRNLVDAEARYKNIYGADPLPVSATVDIATCSVGAFAPTVNRLYLARLKPHPLREMMPRHIVVSPGAAPIRCGGAIYEIAYEPKEIEDTTNDEIRRIRFKLVEGAWGWDEHPSYLTVRIPIQPKMPLSPAKRYALGAVVSAAAANTLGRRLQTGGAADVLFSIIRDGITEATGFPSEIITIGQNNSLDVPWVALSEQPYRLNSNTDLF